MVIVRLALPECVAVSGELANSVDIQWKFNLAVKSALAPNMDGSCQCLLLSSYLPYFLSL